jgi:metallo-beta-lactamase class B
MKIPSFFLAAFVAAVLIGQSARAHEADDALTRAIAPDFAQRWLAPLPPARLHGDTYYVGFAGLGVVLIRTNDGLILIDGAVPQAVREVEANIRLLGFRVEDIRYILSTEPHWDHAGGIAALARDSGATVVASAPAAQAHRTASLADLCSLQATANAPVNASPAPVVSTASTFGAGTSKTAPSAPR